MYYVELDSNLKPIFAAMGETLPVEEGKNFIEVTMNQSVTCFGKIYNPVTKEFDSIPEEIVIPPPQEEPEVIIPVPELTFEEKKTRAINNIEVKRYLKSEQGCPWSFYTVDISIPSLNLLNGSVLMANLGQWNNNKWKMKNNIFVSLTTEQLLDMAVTVGAYINSLYAREEEIRNQLNAATTEAELEFEF